MDRRKFLLNSASAVMASKMAIWSQNAVTAPPALLTIHPDVLQGIISRSFTGLSYESGQLASPGFFSAQNKNLIALYRRLGVGGVLRIGGNTSDQIGWSTQNPPTVSPTYYSSYGPEDAMHHLQRGTITPVAIRNLANFLHATDWKLIYGLNLKHGTPEQAAEEASFVIKIIGPRLIALQIGNEPDLYSRDGTRWTYPYYYEQWQKFEHAIRALHPDAPLAGPDVAHNVEWLAPFANQAGKQANLLTSHYYAEGPPSNPDMNIERLLRPHKRLSANINAIQKISQDSGLPYRLTEGNSCYHGGKPGVSDTFASALWGGDFMFELAQAGFTGVNFHGGGNGCYSPIIGSIDIGFIARPIYYGMLLFSQFAGTSFIPNTFDSRELNLTAYASIAGNKEIRVVIFNKELKQAAQVYLNVGRTFSKADIVRLVAPSVDSQTGVTLGGSPVSANGLWKPMHYENLHHVKEKLVLELPAASAIMAIVR